MVRDLKQEIETGARDLVERIREYSRSQVELWQQVPLLAMEANGGPGGIRFREYTDASEKGYWLVQKTIRDFGRNGISVDLETGELVDPHDYKKPALDRCVAGLAYSLDYINAEWLVAALKAEARRQVEQEIDHPEDNPEGWLEKRKQELQLTEKYQRRK